MGDADVLIYAAGAFGLYYLIKHMPSSAPPPNSGGNWGQPNDPSKSDPSGGGNNSPNNPTDPGSNGDPIWWTSTDDYPTTPFCAINLAWRTPTASPMSGVPWGSPPILSWTPDMAAFTETTCVPIQDSGTNAPPASVAAARKFTGYNPDNASTTWSHIATVNPANIAAYAETMWIDPLKAQVSLPNANGVPTPHSMPQWFVEPAGPPSMWKQGNPSVY